MEAEYLAIEEMSEIEELLHEIDELMLLAAAGESESTGQ